MMILCAPGELRAWPYDENRDRGQGSTRCQETSGVTARAGHRPADDNQEGLRP